MSQTASSFKQQKYDAGVTRVAMNLEVDVIPVSDVERSKQFYQLLGWRLDADDAPAKNVRIVQFTPPGSGCSVTFGNGLTVAAPGSAAAALMSPTLKRLMSNSSAVASTRVRCGTARRSPRRHGFSAPIPSARATGRSSPSMIRTVIRGRFRRSQRGTPAASDRAFASAARFHSLHPAGFDRRTEKNKDEHLSRNQRSSWFNRGSHEGAVHRQDPYFGRSAWRRLTQ